MNDQIKNYECCPKFNPEPLPEGIQLGNPAAQDRGIMNYEVEL